jgi:O-antigen/teichoic acid export membrane protein
MALIYFAYFSFLGSSLIGYFINYRQNLLSADQRNYVVAAYSQTLVIVKTIVQLILAYYTANYYLWVLVEFTFGIVYSFILNWKINQTYPWLKADVKMGRKLFKKYPEVMKKTKQLFLQKLLPFTQYQCSSFLVYAFVSLPTVALYNNYTMIGTKLTQFFLNFYSSLGAGVGNLIAEQNYPKIERIFWELLSVRFIIAGWMFFVSYFLLQPLITVWLGADYLLSDTIVLLVALNLFLRMSRAVFDTFLFGAGLFQDVLAPFVEMIIFYLVALIGGYLIGLPGIVFGGVISVFVIGWGWKPYFLFTRLFKTPLVGNIFILLKYLATIIATVILSSMICRVYKFVDPNASYYELLIYAILVSGTYIVIGMAIMLIFTQGFRDFVLVRLLKRKIA